MNFLSRVAHAKVRIAQGLTLIADFKQVVYFAAAVKIIVPTLALFWVTSLAVASVGALYFLGRWIEKSNFSKIQQDYTVQNYQPRSWEVNELLKQVLTEIRKGNRYAKKNKNSG